jgi:hypothetical protein
MIILNHTKKMFIILRFDFMYYKLQFYSIRHVHYTPYICGKTLLKFEMYFEFKILKIPHFENYECFLLCV